MHVTTSNTLMRACNDSGLASRPVSRLALVQPFLKFREAELMQ